VGGDRVSLQECFDRLLPYYRPWIARERLALALRENRLRLFRDGQLQDTARICSELQVVIEQEADGRWRCAILEPWPPGPYLIDHVEDDGERQIAVLADPPWAHVPVWEVDAEGVVALLPPPPGKRGRKSVQNWTGIVDRELVALRYKGSPFLENFDQLHAHMVAHLKNETKQPPKYPKRFRKRIQDFLTGQIKK
jgi:hypothetical protein